MVCETTRRHVLDIPENSVLFPGRLLNLLRSPPETGDYACMATSTIGKDTRTTAGVVANPGTLDISGLTGDFSITIEVTNLTSAAGVPSARILLEDSVNAFTNSIPVGEKHFLGPITSGAPVAIPLTNRELPAMRNGTASAVLRANLVQIGGTTPTCSINVYLNN